MKDANLNWIKYVLRFYLIESLQDSVKTGFIIHEFRPWLILFNPFGIFKK